MDIFKTIPPEVAAIIPYGQLNVTIKNLPAYQDAIDRLGIALKLCPAIGATDGAKEHPAIFHYFTNSTDVYICEYDREGLMFGYTILGGDLGNSEWGYTNLAEITNIPHFNIDYHFPVQTIEAALYKKYPDYFKKPQSLTE
jgi:hypothetical protein